MNLIFCKFNSSRKMINWAELKASNVLQSANLSSNKLIIEYSDVML